MFDQTNLPIYEVTAELPGGLLRFTFSSLKEAYANYGSLCQKYPNPKTVRIQIRRTDGQPIEIASALLF